MKIAYVISESFSTVAINGIVMQAKLWGNELKRQGHNLIFINPWDEIEWEEFDIIHIFGPCEFLYNFSYSLKTRNPNIVFSPIIDTIQSVWKYKIAANLGFDKLRLASPNYSIKKALPYIKHIFVRSKFEHKYVNKAYSVSKNKISIVPLSYRLSPCELYPEKEDFCFHLSRLTDERKNVIRLIKAAIKFKFQLVLAGTISSDEAIKPFLKLIHNNKNITYLGRLSDEDIISYYSRAKVFALPSINEGVGMVALDAALYGCDIVITELGGPSEYYDNYALKVNPYSINSIGNGILVALKRKDAQPKLMNFLKNEYALEKCVKTLSNIYQKIKQVDYK